MDTATLRLALGMRGGVSLAVWIGGAVAELDHFRHATGDGDDYYSALLAVGRYTAVEIDVMSGASAGGLNAVLAAAAMLGGSSTDGLQRTWLETASLRRLLESADGDGDHRSLLNGSYFLAEIERQVGALLAASTHEDHRLGHRLELFLSATVLGGLPVPIVDDEFSSEQARRSGAVFHFRHFGNVAEVSDLCSHETVPMSRAARTTASFPTAFEPIEYPLSPNDDIGGPDVELEMRGRLLLDGVAGGDLVRLLDGGVVDNIPVARALQGLPSVPAGDATDRWLIYMQPSPDSLPDETSAAGPGDDRGKPGFQRVLRGIVGGFMSESILDDVEVIREHNLAAVASWRAWSASVGDLPTAVETAMTSPVDDATRGAMRRVDAMRIMELLLQPAAELVWRPIGRSVPRSPLRSPGVTYAHTMREAIAAELEQRAAVRPFAAIARTAAILTRWANLAELSELQRTDRTGDAGTGADTASIGRAKQTAYQLMHLAQILTTLSDWSALHRARTVAPVRGEPLGVTQTRAVVETMAASATWLARREDIAELVDALPMATRSLAFGCTDERFGPLLRSLYALDSTGCVPGENGAADDDVVLTAMWARAARVAVDLSAFDVSATGPGSDAVLAAVSRRISDAPDPAAAAAAHLRTIDRRTVGVHRGRASGLSGPVKYLRIGGSNLSPLCLTESEFPFTGARFRTVLSSADGSDVPPTLKLSGSDLANFSAFISQKWRANDWMWGRLDAAKSMVDVVCGGDRLPKDPQRALAVVEAAVRAPLHLPANVRDAWGDEITGWIEQLWAQHRATIASEIEQAGAADGTERLRTTKRVLVLRRHWEILAQELPVFDAADLLPISPGHASLAHEVLPPAEPMTARVGAYEGAPRSFSAVWGSYWLTALAIRSGYALWAATRPRRRWLRWLRAPLKPLPVTLFGVVLARNRGLLAFTVAFNVIVMPRLNGVGGFLGWAAAASASVALAWVFRGRPAAPDRSPPRLRAVPYEPGGRLLVGLAALALLYGLLALTSSSLRDRLAERPGWDVLAEWSPWIDVYTISTFVAAAIAAGLLWYCAQWHFRIVSTLIIGFIAAFWTVFSRWTPPSPDGVPRWRRWLSSLEFAFGSMTWALVAATAATTAITHFAFSRRWPIARYGRARRPGGLRRAPRGSAG